MSNQDKFFPSQSLLNARTSELQNDLQDVNKNPEKAPTNKPNKKYFTLGDEDSDDSKLEVNTIIMRAESPDLGTSTKDNDLCKSKTERVFNQTLKRIETEVDSNIFTPKGRRKFSSFEDINRALDTSPSSTTKLELLRSSVFTKNALEDVPPLTLNEEDSSSTNSQVRPFTSNKIRQEAPGWTLQPFS